MKTGGLRDGVSLGVILAVAAALRAFAWWRTVAIFNDGPIFLGMAQAIDAGRWAEVLAHPYHPLYPALIAFVAQAPISFETAAIVVSIAGGLLSILGIFLFVRRAFGRDLAWSSAWIVALHPTAIDFSSDVMSDGLYAGFFLLGFAAMASLIEAPRLRTALGCGIAVGLAYLVRPEGVGLLVVCGLLLTFRATARGAERKQILVAVVGLVLAAGIVMAPLLGSIFHQTGELSLTRKKSLSGLVLGRAEVHFGGGPALSSGRGDGSPPIPLPQFSERAEGGGAIRPARNVAGMAEALWRTGEVSLLALRYEVGLMALIGIWALRSGRRRILREATVASTAILYSGLLVLLVWGAGYVSHRHALAALLPLCVYAAVGSRALFIHFIDRLGRDRPRHLRRLKTPGSLGLMLVVLLCVVWGARDLRARRPEWEPVRLASEWLHDNAGNAAPVAAQKLRVGYYSGLPFVPLPSGNDGQIERTLRANGVNWVVIDEARLEHHRGLAGGVGEWLVPIHSVEAAGRRAIVLELFPKPAI
ncbi:MAG: glycosyltransferase family 39 protein [bacterium]|nr:hypothetical protein [Deltaproteobacteria bacterium]MCP4903689.1 glycosyltransferase family 39 protein [bacterium]